MRRRSSQKVKGSEQGSDEDVKEEKKEEKKNRRRGEESKKERRSEAVWLYGCMAGTVRYDTVQDGVLPDRAGMGWERNKHWHHPCDSSELDKLVQHSPFLRY